MADYKILLNRAAALCSKGEKCTHDIREKLSQWGLSKAETEKAIIFLVNNKFIDDERYAQLFVKDKLKFNKWGRIKIAYALRQKNIDSAIIDSALSNIDQDLYSEVLDQLIRSKIRTVSDPEKPEDKARLIRFAAQRGFGAEEIYNSISRVLGESDASR